jgi:DNA-binding transcriptional ArsR family regulator
MVKYSKIGKRSMQDSPDYKTRRRVFLVVSGNPGINESELVRLSGLNRGSVRYALEYLEKHELITGSREDKFVHYFPKDKIGSAQKTILKRIQRSIPRSLVVYVLLFPGSGFGQIAAEFELSASTISYHLGRLVNAGILDREKKGKETIFRLRDPETVSDVLVTFQESYLANLMDRWALRLKNGIKGPAGGKGKGPADGAAEADDGERGTQSSK